MDSSISKRVISNSESSKVIVYVHGMGAAPSYFDTIKSHRLLSDYYHFSTLNRQFETFKSIRDQADILTNELIEQLTNIEGKDFDIVFVGHSQGGLVIASALKNLLDYKSNEVNLNLKGIFTIGTPWSGVPIANFAVKHGFIPDDHQGAKDLIPNSSCIKTIKMLFEEISKFNYFPGLKILPVAGKLSRMTKIALGMQLSLAKPFLKLYNKFSKSPILSNQALDYCVSYLKNEEHDLIVQTNSQMGKGIIPLNLLYSKEGVLINSLKHDKVENMIPKPSRIFKGKFSDILRNVVLNTLSKDQPQLESIKVIKLLSEFLKDII